MPKTGSGGTMIAVVGPSGAGKDSLMNAARRHFEGNPRFGFVRRVITRPPDGATEDHDSVSIAQFAAMESAGMFAVWWRAHGLCYGIPASAHNDLEAGTTLIANGSRGALPAFQDRFAAFAVIHVTARPEVIAQRLLLRGRETEAEIRQRLARQTDESMVGIRHCIIDNSGSIEDGANAFIAAVEQLSQHEPTHS